MCGTDTQKQDIATVEEMEFEELVRYIFCQKLVNNK